MPLRKKIGLRLDWGAQLSASSFADEQQTRPPSATAPSDTQFEAIVERFRRPLVGFLFRLVNDERLAEELAEETVLNVYRSHCRFRNDDFAIAIYRAGAAMALRLRHRKAEYPTDAKQSAIRQSVEELPEGERLAVLLHKYQGLN